MFSCFSLENASIKLQNMELLKEVDVFFLATAICICKIIENAKIAQMGAGRVPSNPQRINRKWL